MAVYFVGDIQGCYDELMALLKQANFDKAHDQLWVAGDLVARGPKSLETLRFIKSLGKSAKVVLGNHDLHLLAVYAGIKKIKKQDQLEDLINAPDIDELMAWLIQQPLIQKLPKENTYMSHAGFSPQWTIKQAIQQAETTHKNLNSPQSKQWLEYMYGEQPNNWLQAHSDIDKFRYSINSLTRMRFCYGDGSLEFNYKDSPKNAPDNVVPWYQLVDLPKNTHWVFGHWASLMGECSQYNIYAMDTGCVWGNHLTLLRWHDKMLFVEQSNNNSKKALKKH
ncbi:MAG: bis(5'-nucleosyl)-tetraphosphatase (symmetrical) [Alteromonadaceae bacterium]|jgi:bis(5'-nucleosyl)-tetraphosphatase (symmetrical)